MNTHMSRELWRALLVIHNHYLLEKMISYYSWPRHKRPPDNVIEAIKLLDCCLDVAIQEGWLED